MSWIVQSLLRNSPQLKSNPDIESDDYNNLLLIEKKISELTKIGIISNKDLDLLRGLTAGESVKDLEKSLNINRVTVSKDIDKLCNMLAYYLGGEFTDDGYAAYMQQKYNLTQENLDSMNKYIHGKHSNDIVRKPNGPI